VGIIKRPHGIQGQVEIMPFTDFPERRFSAGACLGVDLPKGEIKKLTVDQVTSKRGNVLVKFEDFSTEKEARALTGLCLWVEEDQVFPLNEGHYYHFELVGLKVVEREQEKGEVVEVIPGPACDYLLVREAKKDYLLPLIQVFVINIDLTAGLIKVDCPEGFWE